MIFRINCVVAHANQNPRDENHGVSRRKSAKVTRTKMGFSTRKQCACQTSGQDSPHKIRHPLRIDGVQRLLFGNIEKFGGLGPVRNGEAETAGNYARSCVFNEPSRARRSSHLGYPYAQLHRLEAGL